ncbi:MAG: TIGR02147 family protein [Chitinivibrionales bacterium]|nr:TIGR02147 family protein [Chitinivibrionales bacterium]
MKSIYDFVDYRTYLSYYYDEKKRSTRHFSYRYFANKAGINSSSFLKHIIDGRRNLTPKMMERFCTALAFSPREATYFIHLVLFNQAKTAREKQEHYSVLRDMIGGVREGVLKSAQYDYFDKWYNSVIRELVCLHDFGDDYQALARAVSPPITRSQAKKSVALLLKLGLLKKNDSGTYEQTQCAITADDSITTIAQRTYVGHMIDLAESALERFDKSRRHISTMTLGVSPATYDILIAEINAFKDRVKRIVSLDKQSTRVCQLNCAIFPVSEDIGRPQQEEERQ